MVYYYLLNFFYLSFGILPILAPPDPTPQHDPDAYVTLRIAREYELKVGGYKFEIVG